MDHSEAASPLLHPARLITVPAEQLAQQLTLVETELFDAVTPVELLVRLWGHEEEGHNLAKRLEMLIAWFNQMSYWVARTVCTPNDAALRARCIEYFVAVADSCRLQHNLASVMAIIAGLSLSAVQRLSKTWAVRIGRLRCALFLGSSFALRRL